MQGIVGGLHFGVGRAAGSMIGGSFMSVFGARIAFRIMGISAGIAAVIYFVIYVVFIRRDELGSKSETKQQMKCENDESGANAKLTDGDNVELKVVTENGTKGSEDEVMPDHLLEVPNAREVRRRISIDSVSSYHSTHPPIQT